MSETKRFTTAAGVPVVDNTNILTAGRRGPALLQDIWAAGLNQRHGPVDRVSYPAAGVVHR